VKIGTGADVVLINCGTFRANEVIKAGPIKMKTIASLLPMADKVFIIKVTGKTLHEALENGVSQYPKLEGRWPAVSCILKCLDKRNEFLL